MLKSRKYILWCHKMFKIKCISHNVFLSSIFYQFKELEPDFNKSVLYKLDILKYNRDNFLCFSAKIECITFNNILFSKLVMLIKYTISELVYTNRIIEL